MQRQDFQGAVSQAIQAETVNQIHIASQGKPLTWQERSDLNSKVSLLESQHGKSGKETWRFLHRTMGVNNIREMTSEHKESAHGLLDLLLDMAEKNAELAALKEPNPSIATTDLERKLQYEIRRVNQLLADKERLEVNLQAAKETTQAKTRYVKYFAILSVVLAAVVWPMSYRLTEKEQVADLYARTCTLNAKRYEIGTTAENLACVKGRDGLATWEQTPSLSKSLYPNKR